MADPLDAVTYNGKPLSDEAKSFARYWITEAEQAHHMVEALLLRYKPSPEELKQIATGAHILFHIRRGDPPNIKCNDNWDVKFSTNPWGS